MHRSHIVCVTKSERIPFGNDMSHRRQGKMGRHHQDVLVRLVFQKTSTCDTREIGVIVVDGTPVRVSQLYRVMDQVAGHDRVLAA